jgi:ferredoxin-NADP reductase
MALIDVVVSDIIIETPSVKTLYLARIDGTPIGKYTPGAHIDVVGPTAITRQYSLCSTPDAEETFAVAVKRDENSRGGSVALHSLCVGDRLQISPPRNLMRIAEDARRHVLIAAGIGITPMLSMARYMDVHGIAFDLHYFARSAAEAPFLPMLQEKCPEKLHAHLGMARDRQEPVLDDALRSAQPDTHVYTCGPAAFMDKVLAVAQKYVPENNVHFENFHAVELAGDGPDVAFDVELDGETYHVPADRSIVEVLDENGCDIDTSCQEGICGTCIMTVLQGTPDHRDNVLSNSEKASGEVIAVCVSRTTDPKMVLDYY